ncbi:hypothetical protein [Mangrovimonas xylaniphaga]|uniref:hypothetical protein n=1 Tax=Mangrovimonas xylaniphaga TaxID=1645915 RepID=UPI0006B68D2F|nr:hypothetical protein [Mangrovimonas xylaniphaga]
MKLLKHTALLGVAVCLLSSFNIAETNVYICKGNYSKKYHYNKSCRGLSNCSTDIYKVSLAEAKELKRTLCGWED